MMMQETPTNERLLIKVTELVEVVKDIREFVPRTMPAKADPPQHGDINWVIDYLEISERTFYRNVRNKLLAPVRRIGTREYYDREEVYDLFRRVKESHRTVGFLTKKQQEEASASFFVPLLTGLGTQMTWLGIHMMGVGTLLMLQRADVRHVGTQMMWQWSDTMHVATRLVQLTPLPAH